MVSKRLKVIANYIDHNDKYIYDVGCDHALLDIYLANKYKKMSFFAIDISKKCIEKALDNIKKYNFENRIRTIVNDGLTNISLEDKSSLIISGMGAHTIIDILNNCEIKKLNKIVIQSNNDLEFLRREMVKKGFFIKDEDVVYDKKYYVAILFIPGNQKYTDDEYLFGPKLLNNRRENIDYFTFLYNKNKIIYKKLPLRKIFKKIKKLIILSKIKKLLKK